MSDEHSSEFSILIHEADTALLSAKSEYRGMLQLSQRLVESGISGASLDE